MTNSRYYEVASSLPQSLVVEMIRIVNINANSLPRTERIESPEFSLYNRELDY